MWLCVFEAFVSQMEANAWWTVGRVLWFHCHITLQGDLVVTTPFPLEIEVIDALKRGLEHLHRSIGEHDTIYIVSKPTWCGG